jgi:hypothetical protein
MFASLVFRNACTVIIAGMNDPGLRDLSAASDLLKPFDAGPEAALPVSARINRVENGDEECARAPLLEGEAADVVKILPLL